MRSSVDTARRVHTLINAERRRRGLGPVYWSRGCANYAQSSADSCAEMGRLVMLAFCTGMVVRISLLVVGTLLPEQSLIVGCAVGQATGITF